MSLERKGAHVAEALKKIKSNLSYNELRIIVAIERAIARLSADKKLANNLVFKGGFVLLKTIATTRFTRDLDAVIRDLPRDECSFLIQKALKSDLGDGLWYGDCRIDELTQIPFPGLRFSIPFQIGEPPRTKAGMDKLSQIYIDTVVDSYQGKLSPPVTLMPSLIEGERPVSWLIYPPEYIFSEKLEALISLGSFNSRAKDLYDLSILHSKSSDPSLLWNAIIRTFEIRKTALPASFSQTAAAFELTALKRAWTGLGKSLGNVAFEELWASVLEVLRKVDESR